jgi:Protein of unknown function (DUF2950)
MLTMFRNSYFPVRGAMLCAVALASISLGAAARPQAESHGPSKKPSSDQKAPERKTFSSAREAAEALYHAAHENDENAMLVILGSGARDLIIWSDDPAERKLDVDIFAKKYEQMHRLVQEPDDETTLYVGSENWPLPIPLVEAHGHWYFDAALGRQEILYRRVGENERRAVDALYSLCMAENEYYNGQTSDPEYAPRLIAEKGKRDGLYWPATSSDDESPIGLYLANAAYTQSDRQPFYGYFFNVLTGQGANARGGARNYVAGSKMTGGFAFIAFPAVYRSSGVKTFIVSRNGNVYEKDLGPNTAKIAAAITTFNPDSTWTRAQ